MAACLLIPAPASADVKVRQVKTEVRFLEVNLQTYRDFSGRIASKKICRDDRDVELFYKPTASSPAQRLGDADTDKSGAFLIALPSPAQAGLYSVQLELDIEIVNKGDDKIKFRCRPVTTAFVSF